MPRCIGHSTGGPQGPSAVLASRNGLKLGGGSAPGQVGDIYMRDGAVERLIATLSYDGTGTRLRKVVLRPDGVTHDSTVFEYDSGMSPKGAFLTAVHDPRSTPAQPIITRFVYDSMTGLPVHVEPPVDRYGQGQAKYRSPWRRAVPRVGYGSDGTLERLVFRSQLIGTHAPVQGQTTDVKVDRFGALTRVRRIGPQPIFTFPFTLVSFPDDIVDIERDSVTALVRKVVRGRLDPANADSAMYWYDALGRVDSVRTASPTGTGTELMKFGYDVAVPTGTIEAGEAWCSRLLWTKGSEVRQRPPPSRMEPRAWRSASLPQSSTRRGGLRLMATEPSPPGCHPRLAPSASPTPRACRSLPDSTSEPGIPAR